MTDECLRLRRGVSVFVCQRKRVDASCVECGTSAPYTCEQELGGKRAGEARARPLCGRCNKALKGMCGPHARRRDAQ